MSVLEGGRHLVLRPSMTRNVALVTQMRAGTHFLCAALRIALRATIYRPSDAQRYVVMEDDYIWKGLRERVALPPASADRRVYFSHYYHPHRFALEPMPRISLVGFPLDSFYSDGIVYSDKVRANDPGPSVSRGHARDYVFRFDSAEWRLLEPRMRENAAWLEGIEEGERDLLIRYEDFFLDFDRTAARIADFTGGFLAPLPKPVANPRRTYWTQRYAEAFDPPALAALCTHFAAAIRRFYPERWPALGAAMAAHR